MTQAHFPLSLARVIICQPPTLGTLRQVGWVLLGRVMGGSSEGGREGGSVLPGNLLSWHLLLLGYRGDVLNAALKIQNTDSSLPPGPDSLPPSLPLLEREMRLVKIKKEKIRLFF